MVLSTRISSPDREQVSAITDVGTNLYNNALQLVSEFRNGTFSNLHPLVSTLRSLLPSVAVQDFKGCPNLTMSKEFVNSALTRLIISSAINNFAGLDGLPHSILGCLRNPTNMRLLQELQSANGPETEAFAENVFYAAVESSNAGIVEYLLRTNTLDPNKLVCNPYGTWRTPIERAVELESMEVTRVLIHAKVDLNRTAGNSRQNQGTLEVAIYLQGWNQSYVSLEIVRMLLEAGAILDLERFERSGVYCRPKTNSLVLLINFYFNASATRHIGKKILGVVLRAAREDEYDGTQWDLAWNVVIGMVETDFTNAINILTEELANLNFALDMAAEHGHLELVKALLGSGTIPTANFLCRGINSGNEELVRYLLDAGADVSGHCSTAAVTDAGLDGDCVPPPPRRASRRGPRRCSYTTPLAEAIRLGNVRILELLQSGGTLLQIEEKSRFSAALTAASEVGDIRFVRELLDIRSVHELLDMEPILDGDELLGALLASVRGSQEEIITMILDNGATAIRSKLTEILGSYERGFLGGNVEDLPIQQALLHASRAGHISIVQKLLGLTSTFGGPCLHHSLLASIEGNHEQVALMLLDAGADPSSECVAAALNVKNFELVNSLLEADAFLRTSHEISPYCTHPPEDCSHPLLVLRATNLGAYSIVERLVAYGANVDDFCHKSESGTALVAAVRKQDVKLVQLLLDSGADIDLCARYPPGVTPLAAAVIQEDVFMTDFLLARGANSADAKALYAGMLRNDLLTEKLLEAFTKQYPHGKKDFDFEVMESAIELGNLNIIRQLLLLPVDLNRFVQSVRIPDGDLDCQSYGRMTPLGFAIMKDQGKHLDIVQMILEAGGDPNSTVLDQYYDKILQTALLVAVDTGNLRMVQLLVDHGARVNCPATMGHKRTPLQHAAEIGSFDIVEYLLSKEAEINAPPARSGGATALQLASIRGYIGIVELLLNSSADPNAPAAKINGRTAIEGAAEFGRVDVLRLLANAGAKMDWRQFERAAWLAEKNGRVATKKYLESLFHETVSVEELLS
jgi:ankyrin repeat protein